MTNVSVLIPCYNAAPYVGAALESVLNQSWQRLEVIVVDDGSTDGSASLLSEYASRGVRVIHQENAGQSAAANRAFRASTGEYIKFFDADDVMAPDMIERQVAQLGTHHYGIGMGEWARFCDDTTSVRFEPLPMYRDAAATDWLVQEWSNAQPMMQCALWLIPRAVLDCSGLWDERLSLINDFEFFTRVILSARAIKYTPDARLYYRSGIAGSLSGRKSRKAVKSAFLSLMLGTQHLLNAENSPRTRRACANMLQGFDYTYYPTHADLRATIRARVAELGGSDLAPDGPPGFQKLRRIVGWQTARRVQHLGERLGLNRASRQAFIANGYRLSRGTD